ncbi:MAG: aspartate carbamoyltransferase catalytic subunit [bacterium]
MDLLALKGATREEILALLALAAQFVDANGQPATPASFRTVLADRSVALMFFEPSTRTRVSFELAATRLGAHPVVVNSLGTSVEKGESILDTCQNLEAMGVDAFVVRHPERSLPFLLADHIDAPIINAGNGAGEHPTQALLDAFTLQRAFNRETFEGLTVAIIGDVVHSRVARSNVHALSQLGASVVLAGPSHLLPRDDEEWPAKRVTNRAEALASANAVIMLRIQRERMVENVDVDRYIRDWSLDDAVVEQEMLPDAVVMHPGPVIRGVELTSSVADGPRSLILRQAGNGVAVRQAVLLHSLGILRS